LISYLQLILKFLELHRELPGQLLLARTEWQRKGSPASAPRSQELPLLRSPSRIISGYVLHPRQVGVFLWSLPKSWWKNADVKQPSTGQTSPWKSNRLSRSLSQRF